MFKPRDLPLASRTEQQTFQSQVDPAGPENTGNSSTWAGSAARSLRLQGQTGQIIAGASADLIVLDQPLEGLSPEALAETRPSATVFEGQIVHGGL